MRLLPLTRLTLQAGKLAFALAKEIVRVGTFQKALGVNVPNVPMLFLDVPALGLDNSGLTRSDVKVWLSTDYLPAHYRLDGTEHAWYTIGAQDYYFSVVCGAVDPTGSFWCLFLRPQNPPK